MEEVAKAVRDFAEASEIKDVLSIDVAEKLLQAAQRLAGVALRSHQGALLDKSLAVSRALADLAWELEGRKVAGAEVSK